MLHHCHDFRRNSLSPKHTATVEHLERKAELMQDEFIRNTILKIRSGNPEYQSEAQRHLDFLTKPIGSLGKLEQVAVQYVAWREEKTPVISGKAVYVFAADHGITDEGVSAYPRDVTPQMVYNFLNGGAAINVLARQARIEVVVVDVGVDASFQGAERLVERKIRRGTRNFAKEPAMTLDEVHAALKVGIELANEAKQQGRTLIALGEMGIGNTTSASAITAALTGLSAAQVTGKGTGLDADRCRQKAEVIDKALRMHFPERTTVAPEALEVLRRVGGLEIAAIAGMVLGAASQRIAVVIDGFICTAGAAIACALAPNARAAIFAGHLSEEPGHRILLERMNLKPLLQLDMRLGEGTGATLAFHLIEASMSIYNEMATFESAGISKAAH
jgi:nicotinate-nucleotide--dimethylbenzimidazole phosphoribosyltransferase